MTEALRNASFGIALWKALSNGLLLRNRCREQDKKVVVLMPPPVDAGEAPINISPETTSRPAVEKSLRL